MTVIDTLKQAILLRGIAEDEITEGSEGTEFSLVVQGSVAINKNVAGGECDLGI